jgi:multidrug efflux system membrane fusion protein
LQQTACAQNATSREESERFESDAAVAQARLAAANAALTAARLNLSFTRVTAPIAGRVSRAIVTAGNLVDSSTLLTTVVSDSPVYAYFDIDEQTYLASVHAGGAAEGSTVRIGLSNEQGYPHTARLDFVDNSVDPGHGTIRARAVLDNADGRFTPGLFVRIKLVSPATFRAALVDDRAIGTDLGRKFVLVVDERSVVQYRPVVTGKSVEGLRVVTHGLDAGDVRGRPIAQLGHLARRPRYSVLGSKRGELLPPLEDALPRFIERFAMVEEAQPELV